MSHFDPRVTPPSNLGRTWLAAVIGRYPILVVTVLTKEFRNKSELPPQLFMLHVSIVGKGHSRLSYYIRELPTAP